AGVFHVEDDLNAGGDGFTDSSRLLSPLEASQLLTDEYSAKILLATYKRKISAQEISQRYGIPIAACYRKIRILEEVGLIQCVERILTQKGKRKNLYTSCLRNAYIFFENGKLRARFQLATGQVKDFGGDWNGLDLMKQCASRRTRPSVAGVHRGPTGTMLSSIASENHVVAFHRFRRNRGNRDRANPVPQDSIGRAQRSVRPRPARRSHSPE